MRWLILVLIPVMLGQAVRAGTGDQHTGVLILAHGGSPRWDSLVLEAVKPLRRRYIVEVAFGMANPVKMQRAITALEQQGVKQIVAVQLFISSHSPIVEQNRYLLGLTDTFPSTPMVMVMDRRLAPLFRALRELPPEVATGIHLLKPSPDEFRRIISQHFDAQKVQQLAELYAFYRQLYEERLSQLKPLEVSVPVKLTPALDDHPLVARILYERIKAISRDPAREFVILVAHGPNEEEHNVKWLKSMESLASQIQALAQKEQGTRFKGIFCVTVRDDAPPLIYNQAKEHLRALVRQASREGEVLVVPLLLAPGGVEEGIWKRLEGLPYRRSEQMLLPHPLITEWIENQVEKVLD